MTTRQLLHQVQHRPWALPNRPWQFYQEWNDVLFLHFKIDKAQLRTLVPESLPLDLYEEEAYISLVAFKMERIHPRGLPPFAPISNFYEINIRTYVEVDGKKGVYFINIEAEKWLSALVAKTLSGLPYEYSKMARNTKTYKNDNTAKDFQLEVEAMVGELVSNKTPLDLWLTERYCLYLDKKNGLYRFDIHHLEWILYEVETHINRLNYHFKPLNLSEQNLVAQHYSSGVQVVSWRGKRLNI